MGADQLPARCRQHVGADSRYAEERSADFGPPDCDRGRPTRAQVLAPLRRRSGLRQAHGTSGDRVYIGAVHAAIAIDVPAWVEGSSRFDLARQLESVEDIDSSVAVDV